MPDSLDPTAPRRPLRRRWWLWAAILFFIVMAARGALREPAIPAVESTAARPAPGAAPAQAPQPAPAAAPAAGQESEARAYARRVRTDLDVTTLEQLTAQMPDTLQPKIERRGENRTFTWAFADGSQLAATFRPLGGEGSERGLVLYMVDIK